MEIFSLSRFAALIRHQDDGRKRGKCDLWKVGMGENRGWRGNLNGSSEIRSIGSLLLPIFIGRPNFDCAAEPGRRNCGCQRNRSFHVFGLVREKPAYAFGQMGPVLDIHLSVAQPARGEQRSPGGVSLLLNFFDYPSSASH
jgi:hypothetical protein